MRQLRTPERIRRGLTLLAGLPDEPLQALIVALETEQPATDVDQLIEHVAARVGGLPQDDLTEIVSTLDSLSKARQPEAHALEPEQYAALKGVIAQLLGADAAAESALAPAQRRLDDLSRLPPDWSPRGSKPPTLPALLSARALLINAFKRLDLPDKACLVPYHIAPVVNGGIAMSWRSDWAQLWVTIGPRGDYRFYWEDRHDPDLFEEQANVSPGSILQQLAKTLRRPRERP